MENGRSAFWNVGRTILSIGNAFFVGFDVAITSVRRSRIKQLADMGDKRAKIVKLLHDEPIRFYAATHIGIILVKHVDRYF